MATKKELEELIIRVDESVNSDGGIKDDIVEIKVHLKKQNGHIDNLIEAESKTREIAKSAEKKAETNSKNFIRLLIGMCLALAATILGIGISSWLA